MANRSNCLVNSNRSRLKSLSKIQITKIDFQIYFGKVISTQGKEPPLITTKKELKKYAAREEWKKLIAQGWRRTE